MESEFEYYPQDHPWVEMGKEMQQDGTVEESSLSEDKEPHRGDPKLFWDEGNWKALCKRCHDRKTMTEDRWVEYRY